MQIVIVTDDVSSWSFLNEFPIIAADDYLKGNPYQTKSLRVVNLCQSYEFQTIGYYVSLLASAQDQKITPSIQTIQDGMNTSLSKQFLEDMDEEIQNSLKTRRGNELTLHIYFGGCSQKSFEVLAKKIYEMFPLPLLTLNLSKKNELWSVDKLSTLTVQDVPAADKDFMQEMAKSYLSKKRFYSGPHKKQHFFHLAILTEEDDEYTPSTQETLDKFVQAGESLGIQVDFIGKNDMKLLPEYAGLFIRTTTRVDHFTYQFARYAAQENLVVIDDPQSILKCCNKVYQAVAFQSHNIKTPHTIVVSKYQQNDISVPFPCVIKRPDSECCMGVEKAENAKELKKILKKFFKFSDLVIIQSFLPTEFDWRIGIIDRKPLYARRYYMAKDHWQVTNWAATTDEEGHPDFSMAVEEVPEGVIQIALRAANLMGDSLYGVDVKTYNNEHYVIEVNDNPGIDAGEEDSILGDEFYKRIMTVFLQRMQAKHGMPVVPMQETLVEHDEI
ncbi:MAG: RimK family protein [Gammaproteobacteria bacterium]